MGGARLRAALPAAIVAGATLLAMVTGLMDPAERLASNLRTRLLATQVDSDVLIVGIDAHSLKSLNRWPWSRGVHGRLLQRLDAAGPRAVFFDVDFSVPSGDAGADAAFARALQRPRAYPVLLPAFWQQTSAGAPGTRMLTEPLPELAAGARTALVNVLPGPDGMVREVVHHDRFGSREYHSAAAILTGRTMVTGVAYPIDFRISPESFDYVSYADVLAGKVTADRLRGRTVLIGATALELGDNLPVPVFRTLPGVTLQAITYETLARGLPAGVPAAASSGLSLALLVAWSLVRHRGWRIQVPAAAGAALVVAGLSVYLHGAHGLLLDIAPPLLTLVLCLFTGMVLSADRQSLRAMLATLKLAREQALISGVFRASIDGILVIEAGGRIRDANPAAAELLGTRRSMLVGRSIDRFLPELAPDGGPRRQELRAVTADGQRPVEVSLSPAGEDRDGLVTVIVRDITERHRQQAVLRHQATHDPLTRLPNRTLLNRLLEQLSRDGGRAALFMLDLDGFKRINDTLGHGVGDQVLRTLGRRLRQALPADVKVFRIGGDEFAVLVSRHAGRTELEDLAGQIIARVREPVAAGGTRLELGGSIGIALYPQDARTGAMLLQCADVAMYAAKERRGSIEFYDPRADHNTLRNLEIAGALRNALASEHVSLTYQPKLRLADGLCTGVEALIRWTDPALGPVSPAEFVPLAESSDLIDVLTRFTLDRALRDQARWCARGIDVVVSVNLSARHLSDLAFAEGIVTLIRKHGMRPSSLELEITETALMEDPERARLMLDRLTRQGVRLAIDDFGTGFSSLAYLKHLNLHALKIDRCFVQDLPGNPSDRKIVESTLSMAHSLDLEVVAEGIETTEQSEILRSLGCDLGQGFGLARPMSADDFPDWYRTHQTPRRTLRSVSA